MIKFPGVKFQELRDSALFNQIEDESHCLVYRIKYSILGDKSS